MQSSFHRRLKGQLPAPHKFCNPKEKKTMAKMFWEKDANPKALQGKRLAVLGYGSQGRAQALNLRDSGIDVVLGQRRGGPSGKLAEQDGWKLLSAAEATKGADLIVMLP